MPKTQEQEMSIDPIRPEMLESLLAASWPASATSWGQAGEEVKDMCRAARELAGVPDQMALDFRRLRTPSQWNSEGVSGIVRFYAVLDDQKRKEFCARFEHWLRLPATS